MKHSFKKLRANSLSIKIIVMVEIALILSCGIFCVISIINSRSGIKRSIRQRMLDIVNCASGSLNGDVLAGFTADSVGTPEYNTVYDKLAVFRDNAELEYIYAIKQEGEDKYIFTLDTDPNGAASYGDEVVLTQALRTAGKGTAAVDEVPYTDEWGTFYSAYSPVFDSSGKVAGIIAADFSSDWFNSQLSQQTTTTIISYCLIMLVTIFIMALLSMFTVTPFVLEQERLSREVEKKAKENKELTMQIVRSLAGAVDAKDTYTKGHSERVSKYSVMIAEALGWDEERINDLRYAAQLHDIGKIGIPDSILNNPKPLTDVEYNIIKSHTTIGADILKNKIMSTSAEEVARSHHEKYDGSGYPLGRGGKEISEEARIVAIADAFDAMNSNRIYRNACDRDYIRRELEEGKGVQFDPDLVDIFINLWDQGLLDPIMDSDPAADTGSMEGFSSLLQEALDYFVEHQGENTFVNPVQNEEISQKEIETEQNEKMKVVRVIHDIHKSGSYNGALDVEYNQFVKFYEYISNLEKRFAHPYKLILITMNTPSDEVPNEGELEKEMFFMERSIQQTIRNVDILTRYGNHQFLIILLGTGHDGAIIAVERILTDYYKMNGSTTYLPSYFIAESQED